MLRLSLSIEIARAASGRIRPLPLGAILLILIGSLHPRTALGQERFPNARDLAGVVIDSSGGVIPGAMLTLRASSAADRTATADAAGRFLFERVGRFPVLVMVTVDRFAPVALEVAAPRTDLRIVMQPLPLTEQILVKGVDSPDVRRASATKTETPLRDVPQAITVLTRTFIADQGMQSMADLVRYVPGVGMAQGEGNRDTPIFRGNTSTSDFYVDGVRDDVQYFRDLYNVERVEALKGPNAMMFGRGGVGGVINRVTRQADWVRARSIAAEVGSYTHRRISGDVGQPLTRFSAVRMTAMYENSGSYRRGVALERYGANPTAAFSLGPRTILRLGYEHFHDDRTADRGVPSFGRRPVATSPSVFFGNPELSVSRATVNSVTASVDHRLDRDFTLRNRLTFADYGKFYQNVYPATAVDPSGTTVGIAAYNNASTRTNFFNQTDLIGSVKTGRLKHAILAGAEVGRQRSGHFRNTGYFASEAPSSNVTTVIVPLADPIAALPVTFRQSATDADNQSDASAVAVYAQDQVEVSSHVQAVFGIRYDHFDVDARNNRTGLTYASRDVLVSPRAGVVYKAIEPLSLYGSYTVSYLPRAGEQLSSLSLTNQTLDPEKFRNYEVGAKWQMHSSLAVSAAAYRLDRGNVAVPDPADATRMLLVDGQRTKGIELDLAGRVFPRWTVLGAYALQSGEVTRSQSATVRAGARLAQPPRHSFAIWNKYEVTRRWAAGAAVVHRTDMFASGDNTVTLPRFTRMDGAVFFIINRNLRGQANVENLFDSRHFLFSNGNNNITPASPRALRVTLTSQF